MGLGPTGGGLGPNLGGAPLDPTWLHDMGRFLYHLGERYALDIIDLAKDEGVRRLADAGALLPEVVRAFASGRMSARATVFATPDEPTMKDHLRLLKYGVQPQFGRGKYRKQAQDAARSLLDSQDYLTARWHPQHNAKLAALWREVRKEPPASTRQRMRGILKRLGET